MEDKYKRIIVISANTYTGNFNGVETVSSKRFEIDRVHSSCAEKRAKELSEHVDDEPERRQSAC